MAHVTETRVERLERVTRERAAQGFPTPATDPSALRLTASILRDIDRRTAEAS